MGKGSKRRPQNISDEQLTQNWGQIFQPPTLAHAFDEAKAKDKEITKKGIEATKELSSES